MKKTTILLMAMLILVGAGLAAWDYTLPKPAKDIADAVVTVPRSVIDDHGMSDRTIVYYNLFKLWEVAKAQNSRIEELEGEGAILLRLLQELGGITDPNEVAK